MRKLFAVPMSGGDLTMLSVLAVIVASVTLAATVVAAVIWPWLGLLIAVLGVALAAVVVAAFKLPVRAWGGTFLKFENVPKNASMVLRWKFHQGQAENPELLYEDMREGVVLWSPWLYVREALLLLDPVIIPQSGDEVNASDGTIVIVDSQVTARIKCPIQFLRNVGNNRDLMTRITNEYLHEALEYATASPKGDVEAYSSIKLTSNERRLLDDVSRDATVRINRRLAASALGFEVKVGVTSLKAPRIIAAAQEAAAAAAQDVKEKTEQAKGMAEVITRVAKAPGQALGQGTMDTLQAIVSDPGANSDERRIALEVLNKVTPNATVLTGIVMGAQVVVDALQLKRGGKRSASDSEDRGKKDKPKKETE